MGQFLTFHRVHCYERVDKLFLKVTNPNIWTFVLKKIVVVVKLALLTNYFWVVSLIFTWCFILATLSQAFPHEIEPATTECRAETLPLSYWSILHTRDAKIHLFPCPWGYNNYVDAYFQSSWEDMALEVTMSSVKSTDVTYQIHSC